MLTLPKSVRRAAQVQPGDALFVEALGAGRIELRALPRMRLAEALERYRIERPVDEVRDRAEWQDRAAADVVNGEGGP